MLHLLCCCLCNLTNVLASGRECMVEDELDVQPPPPPADTSIKEESDRECHSDAARGPIGNGRLTPPRAAASHFPFVRSVADLSSGPGSFPEAGTGSGSAIAALRGSHATPSGTPPVALTEGGGSAAPPAVLAHQPSAGQAPPAAAVHASSPPQPPTAAEPASRPVLTPSDGILVVQYQLPVRLWHDPDLPGAEPGSRVWHAEWDEEALLSPKHQPGGGSLRGLGAAGGGSGALSRVRIKWIGTPPLEVEPACEEAGESATAASFIVF